MDRQWLEERFKIFVPLAAGVYLGFYLFGLVMGVFGFREVPVIHAIAAICLLVVLGVAIAVRRGISPFAPGSPLARAARRERETRGF